MLPPEEHNALLTEYEALRDDFFVRFDRQQAKGKSWTPQQYNAYRVGVDKILDKMDRITQKTCGFLYQPPPPKIPIHIPF